MKPAKNRLTVFYTIFKWLVLIFSYGFLIYKLSRVNFQELHSFFSHFTIHNFQWLIYVLLLLPVNWLMESYKWQFLCSPFEKLTLATSVKSVLAGLTTGFLSPNRIGEVIGRPVFLKEENRISGIMMTVISGFSQTLAIVACGIPSALFFFVYSPEAPETAYKHYILFCVACLLILLICYIKLPGIAGWLVRKNIGKKIHHELTLLAAMSAHRLLIVFLYSLFRYAVFCLQFYLLLFFCNVYITPMQALIAITLNYLFITITPSMSFSEVAIRASYAVFFVGFYSDNIVGIACAGVLLWIINFIIPMLVGSFFFARSKI